MDVPKTRFAADEEIALDTLHGGNNTQDKEADKPLDKENQPGTSDEYQNLNNPSTSDTGRPVDSYNHSNTNDIPHLLNSRPAGRFPPLMRQIMAATPSLLISFVSGLAMGYPSVLIPQLMFKDTENGLDYSTISWIGAIMMIPIAPACVISGLIMEFFGRRITQGIACASFLLSWVIISSANNIPLLLIGRFFTGICIGLSTPVSVVYIAELMETRCRGFFLAALPLTQTVGIQTMNIMGGYLTWQWAANICCLFPILAIVILLITPESPTWLIANRRLEDGVKSYGLLRGYSAQANADLSGILEKQKEVDSGPAIGWLEKLSVLKRELLKPLFIVTLFFIVLDLSGVNYIMIYFISIIHREIAFGTSLHVVLQTFSVAFVIMSALGCVVCQCLSRRLVCLFSGIITALSLVGLSLWLVLTEDMHNMTWLSLLLLGILGVYFGATFSGLLPLAWVMCGELFPSKVRSFGCSASLAIYFVVSFVSVILMPLMIRILGNYIFLICGVLTSAGTVVLYYILPETKGKSLQEIAEMVS